MKRKLNAVDYFVPTLLADGVRHIIQGRDYPPLCGVEAAGEQEAPRRRRQRDLCPRCAQQYAKTILAWKRGAIGWEEPT